MAAVYHLIFGILPSGTKHLDTVQSEPNTLQSIDRMTDNCHFEWQKQANTNQQVFTLTSHLFGAAGFVNLKDVVAFLIKMQCVVSSLNLLVSCTDATLLAS